MKLQKLLDSKYEYSNGSSSRKVVGEVAVVKDSKR